ncbi:hypothetical protein CEQ90_04180 [Lewinellaceae bacterium SD302]|nr:hypothetical protein CEQ90_04180 [Lewinellaceae bacterium SD302]
MSTKKSLFLWGGFTTVAYALTQLFQSTDILGHTSVTAMWGAAFFAPIVVAIKDWPVKKNTTLIDGDETGAFWTGLCLLGMSVTFFSLTTESHDFKHFSFRTLWFIVGALGFVYVGAKALGKRRLCYLFLSVINLLVAVVLFVNYDLLKPVAFGLAVIIQGLPIIVDGLTYQEDNVVG